MEIRRASYVVTSILNFLTLVWSGAEACEPKVNGGMTEDGDGCYAPCNVFDGKEVHLLFRNIQYYDRHRGDDMWVRVSFAPLTTQKDIILVLASRYPIKWTIYLRENLRISQIMLLSFQEQMNKIKVYNPDGTRTFPSTIKRYLPFGLDICVSKVELNAPILVTRNEYGYITSYTCTASKGNLRLKLEQNSSYNQTKKEPCEPRLWFTPRIETTTRTPTTISVLVSDKQEFPESMFIGVMMTAFFGFLPLFLCLCCVCFRARRVRTQPPILSRFISGSGSAEHHVRIAGAYPPGEFPPTIHITGAHPPKYPTVPATNRQRPEPIAPPPYEASQFSRMSPPPYEEVAGVSGKENMS